MKIIKQFIILFSSHLSSYTDFLSPSPFLFPLTLLRCKKCNMQLSWKNFQGREVINFLGMAKLKQAKAEEKATITRTNHKYFRHELLHRVRIIE